MHSVLGCSGGHGHGATVREGRSFMTTAIVLRSFGVCVNRAIRSRRLWLRPASTRRRVIADVRRAVTAFAALAVILAVFPLVELTTAIPAGAAPGLLSCNGSTIYSVERGSSASSTGTLNALTTSTVGGSSVTATAVSTIPAPGGNTNALGITNGGTAAYMVDQTATAINSAVIHRYDALTGTWSTFTGSSGISSAFVAGAVNQVTVFTITRPLLRAPDRPRLLPLSTGSTPARTRQSPA